MKSAKYYVIHSLIKDIKQSKAKQTPLLFDPRRLSDRVLHSRIPFTYARVVNHILTRSKVPYRPQNTKYSEIG